MCILIRMHILFSIIEPEIQLNIIDVDLEMSESLIQHR
jgi:hypothetical protein